MDVRRLDLLRELAQRGSIAAVAAAAHRTPSAVSQQLKVLEREAGVPLTEPSGRGIRLTGAGRMLAESAADVAASIARLDSVWREFTGAPQGVVTLSVFASGGQMFLPGVLGAVAGIPRLDLVCTDRVPRRADSTDLVADVDIVVADAPELLPSWREQGLAVVPLITEPLDVAMPEEHPLAAKAVLSPRDVIEETWIGVPAGQPFDRVLQRIEVATGGNARVAHRFSDNGIVEALVAAGHGIAVLPRYTTRDHENGLTTRPLRGIEAHRRIAALMLPERAERLSVRRIVELLRAEAERLDAAHR
ncbi:MAG: LysR family transcriptional regulator [Microbacteriaceae bacterium]